MHDLVAPYALDALDERETASFETHLATCARCRADLAGLTEGAGSLAESVAEPAPAWIKEAVLDATREDIATVTSIDRKRVSGWLVASVAAAVALVFAGLWAITSSQLSEANRVAAVYEAPDATLVELDGSHGPARLVFSPSLGEAVLNGARLAVIDESQVYEMWLIDDQGSVAAGTFQPGNPSVLVDGLATGMTFAVTIEEAPGVEQTTQDPVLATEI